MIYSLRRKLIWICGGTTAAVLLLIFALICALSMHQLDSAMAGKTGTVPVEFKHIPFREIIHPILEVVWKCFVVRVCGFDSVSVEGFEHGKVCQIVWVF